MGSLTILDTNALLYMLAGRLVHGLPPGEYAVSVVTEMELLSFPALSQESEAKIRALLTDVEVVELTTEIKRVAILVRRQHRLKLPDAIIAATALVLDGELITNDARLSAVAGLTCRALDLRES